MSRLTQHLHTEAEQMVMLTLPLKEELFAFKAIPSILRSLALGRQPNIPKSTLHRTMRALKQADIVAKDLSLQVPVVGDGVVLNTRDQYVAKILSSQVMGPLLSILASGRRFGVRELASILKCEPSTVKRVLDKLRATGLVEDGHLSTNVIHCPVDPIEEVPRLIHRKALKYFLSFLVGERYVDAVIAYGDVVVGKPTKDIEVLVVRKLTERLSSLVEVDKVDGELALKMVKAAHQVSIAYSPIHLNLSIVDGFDWQSYQFISKPFLSTRLYRASQGVVVYGDATVSLAKLLEQWGMMVPASPDEFARMIEKGYAIKTEKGLEATMKWVDDCIAKATTKANEDEITVNVGNGEVKMTIPRIVLVKSKD